ncbi:hypothetical protein YC2023_068795 [Brassica napus]
MAWSSLSLKSAHFLLVLVHVLGKCLTSRAGCILQFLCFSFFSVSPAGCSCAELG